jgi:hypothetical protein
MRHEHSPPVVSSAVVAVMHFALSSEMLSCLRMMMARDCLCSSKNDVRRFVWTQPSMSCSAAALIMINFN